MTTPEKEHLNRLVRTALNAIAQLGDAVNDLKDDTPPAPLPHARLRAQYAEDAKWYNEPWKLWQVMSIDTWIPTGEPTWNPHNQYRRCDATIKAPGDTWLPAPVDKIPADAEKYYAVSRDTINGGHVTHCTPAMSHPELHCKHRVAYRLQTDAESVAIYLRNIDSTLKAKTGTS